MTTRGISGRAGIAAAALIARAIVDAAADEGIDVPEPADFESITGMGVRASVDGRAVEVGADRHMRSLGLDVAAFATVAKRLGGEGKSPLYAAIDGRLAAILAVADPVKPDTAGAIDALHARGGHFTQAYCWAHVRRKFLEIENQHPGKCEQVLDLIGQLYEVERFAKDKPPDEVLALREERARPILLAIQNWALEAEALP